MQFESLSPLICFVYIRTGVCLFVFLQVASMCERECTIATINAFDGNGLGSYGERVCNSINGLESARKVYDELIE